MPDSHAEVDDVGDYFTRAAATFDSLYAEREMGSVERAINRQFRRDILERYVLTMKHVSDYGLQSVLDVGCGSGRYLAGLHELGVKRLVGIDLSSTMIELAQRRLNVVQLQAGAFALWVGDFANYESSELFDVVIALGVFDYVREPVPFLQRMAQVARHSIVVSFPSISVYRTPIRKLRYRIKRCPVYFYDRERIEQITSTVGFSRTQIVKIRGAGQDFVATLFK